MKLKITLSILLIAGVVKAQQKEDFRDDWAALHHYKKQNDTLQSPLRGEKRVVFLGSSIIEFWKDRQPEFWQAHPNFVDRGISGQISSQLLIRFQQDVISLKPKAVVILAGSNDLAGNTGHVTFQSILNNIKSMVELSQKNGIKPIICLNLPVVQYPWKKDLKEVPALIIGLNTEIKAYAEKENLKTLDFWTPLLDEATKGTRRELTLDGVHPNKLGYEIMAKTAEEKLKKYL